jgi:hypothetical protein
MFDIFDSTPSFRDALFPRTREISLPNPVARSSAGLHKIAVMSRFFGPALLTTRLKFLGSDPVLALRTNLLLARCRLCDRRKANGMPSRSPGLF